MRPSARHPAIVWTGTLAALLVGAAVLAGEPGPFTTKPAWSVELSGFGYKAPTEKDRTDFPPESLTGIRPLHFTDNDTVVASFLTREWADTLGGRESQEHASPLRLHLLFLDADSGRIKEHIELDSPSMEAGILAATDGRFVVRLGDRLVLCSAKDCPIEETALVWDNSEGPYWEYWNHYASCSGRTIVLEHLLPSGRTVYQRLDTNSLERTPLPEDLEHLPKAFAGPSYSDGAVARVREPRFLALETWMRDFGGAWEPVCQPPSWCGTPHFLNEGTLVLHGAHRFKLIKANGAGVLSYELGSKEGILDTYGFPGVLPAADGQSFAVVAATQKGGSTWLDTMPTSYVTRVLVFDMKDLEHPFSIEAKKLKHEDVLGVALSPDRSLLAVMLKDGRVQLYKVTGPGSKGED